MKGESILPTSSFQMIARTRNMKDLTYYCVENKSKEYKYEKLDDVKKMVKNDQNITSLYMACFYLDIEAELLYVKINY